MFPLIRVEQLQSLLHDPNVIVIDCRHDLAQPAACGGPSGLSRQPHFRRAVYAFG